ncbi:MAG TPA: 3D-(3,5/4)-trihydroxycyclohexane-1,2-dione acylhydrolase (decyclizing) [Spirochaetia bacterium]|nr:3D-(3,5/4)-trihydroxycyclohexane-1,2-dione acylhydrolase (decyclizing) [Spirochaetia bacterium]
MKSVRLTMAQALLRFLDAQYVDFDGVETKFVKGVGGIFGHGNVVGLGEALAQGGHGLTYFQGHNEQGAAHMAIGYAKQMNRRQIMAVTSSIGPGALNMVTAAGVAMVNRIPVLLLPGDVFACRQPDPVLQQVERWEDYTATANDAFRAVSRYWDRINRPEQLMAACINAMRVLTDPAEAGPVTLALPQDVQGEACDYPQEFLEKRTHYVERRLPTRGQIDRAAALVKTRSRPILICGGGVRYSEAGKELAEFCKAFGVPMGETQAGKGVISWEEPFNLGGIGVTGGLAANRIAHEADLVIAVGTRLGDFTTGSRNLFKNPNAVVLSINVNSFDAAKMNAATIVADARESLKAMTAALRSAGWKAGWKGEVEKIRFEWRKEEDRLYTQEDPAGLSEVRLLGELNEHLLPHDAIVVGASGSLPGDLQRVWRTRAPDSYHMEYGFSCMGYEIAAAVGAKMAAPHREVVALVGDGSYVMLHSELLTAIQEGIKIHVVVFDNAGYQCIDNLQTSQGIVKFGNDLRRRDPKTGRLTGSLIPLDFAKNGESYGAKGYSPKTLAEFRDAVKSALAGTVSTVIDVKVTQKSMTHDYESWWRVGTAQVSENPKVVEAAKKISREVETARKF